MPTNLATQTTVLEGYFETQWASATTVVWPDDPDDVPETDEWVRWTLVPFSVIGTSLGPTPTYRHTGEVWVSVYTPRGQGPNRNDVLCDLVVTAYRDVTDSGVIYGVPRREPGTDETWLQQIVKVPFRWDTT